MNGQLELRIITQPYSAVYWGYFRRLVFGNSLTKHIKLNSFSYSVVIFFLPISQIPPCFHANTPDFPRLIGPRVHMTMISSLETYYLYQHHVTISCTGKVINMILISGMYGYIPQIGSVLHTIDVPNVTCIHETTSFLIQLLIQQE